MGFRKEDHTGEMPFSSHCITGYILSTSLIIGDTNLDPLVKVESARCFHCDVTTFVFPYSVLWQSAHT